jgi:hypothetical protein
LPVGIVFYSRFVPGMAGIAGAYTISFFDLISIKKDFFYKNMQHNYF